MPTHHLLDGALAAADVPLLVIGAHQTDDGPVVDDPSGLGEALGFDLTEAAAATGFDGSLGSVARVPAGAAVTAQLVAVVGLGSADDVGTHAIRSAAAAAAGVAERRASLASSLGATSGVDADAAARAAVEGFELGAHRFRAYKTDDDEHQLADVHHAVAAGQADAVRLGEVSAAATILVRELGNTPPVDKRPPAFADRAAALVADLPITVTTLDEAALVAGDYGGHLAVGAGSTAESRLVELAYRPEGAATHVALVGKGITFDSGGLSLKPPKAQEWMKIDMAGAATVLAVVRAAAMLELPVAVTGLLCLAENMPSGGATRPGDVITCKGGTTVEVLNTDAEGRLVLADGLVHAGELDPAPDIIVDLATLTGGVIAALGPKFTGLMSEAADVRDALLAAAEASDEPMWELPLGVFQYDADLKSDIADIRNIGGEGASTTRAGLFLRRFRPEGIPWAHLDIAGAAWNNGSPFHEVPKGATGLPARTMIDWLRAQ